jgi:hypothetical protein
MAEEQGEEQVETTPKVALSDTGLFYLLYANDSGHAVSSNAQTDVENEFFARMEAAASRSLPKAARKWLLSTAGARLASAPSPCIRLG